MRRFSNSKVLKSVLCAGALVGCAPDAANDDTSASAQEPLEQWVVGVDRAGQDDDPIDDGWNRERDDDDVRIRRPQRPRTPNAPEGVFIRVQPPARDRSNSVKVLDVADWSRRDRGAVQLWEASNRDDNANQHWRVYQRGNSVIIQNEYSGKCLDETQDTREGNGREVYQYTCDSRKLNQRWDVIGRRGGYVALRNQQSGRCLDVTNLEYRDGASLQVWDCNGQWNQSWDIW